MGHWDRFLFKDMFFQQKFLLKEKKILLNDRKIFYSGFTSIDV